MIMGVALIYKQVVICLPKPNRHADCFTHGAEVLGLNMKASSVSGFYLADGTFLDRWTAMNYARKHGLLITETTSHSLTSNDLW